MKSYLIRNINIVNEGAIKTGTVLVRNGLIERIESNGFENAGAKVINGEGLYLLPGLIDDQVHFREPGLTHKAEIYTESRAAVAGGITSFMEMPNTNPPTLNQELLSQKYDIASQKSLANYSFYMGVSNDNREEVLRTDKSKVCGIKIFMGSSTGNMLVDSEETLRFIFSRSELLIATHCEDENTIKQNFNLYSSQYGDKLSAVHHPLIRSHEACYLSSSFAVSLARETGARLHVLHISTARELELFKSNLPLKEKKISSEVCLHHLWFTDEDYFQKGNWIKWNPAIKTAVDRDAILKAVNEGIIDVLASDHAPHTIQEKEQAYTQAPSGGPLVQHVLPALLEMFHQGKITLETIAEKYSHNVASLFRIKNRGFIREGYSADLVLVNLNSPFTVQKSNLLYKCGWSPFEGQTFRSSVEKTFVNGNLVYDGGKFDETIKGERLYFDTF